MAIDSIDKPGNVHYEHHDSHARLNGHEKLPAPSTTSAKNISSTVPDDQVLRRAAIAVDSSNSSIKKKPTFRHRNFWVCFAISLGQIAFGYPSSIIAVTLAQPTFLSYMGLINADGTLSENATDLIGATSGVFQVS